MDNWLIKLWVLLKNNLRPNNSQGITIANWSLPSLHSSTSNLIIKLYLFTLRALSHLLINISTVWPTLNCLINSTRFIEKHRKDWKKNISIEASNPNHCYWLIGKKRMILCREKMYRFFREFWLRSLPLLRIGKKERKR